MVLESRGEKDLLITRCPLNYLYIAASKACSNFKVFQVYEMLNRSLASRGRQKRGKVTGTAVAHILGRIVHILGHITSRLPHQLTTKPRIYCVHTVFLYVFVDFVKLTWHIRYDPQCKNRWNFFST